MTKAEAPRPSYREVLDHIRQHHPGCPGRHAHRIITRVIGRPHWRGVRLGEAVGVEMQNYVRHHLTNYDNLLALQGLDKAEARSLIKGKVRKIIAKWDRSKGAPAEPAAPEG